MTDETRPSIAELQKALPLVRHPNWIRPSEWEEARDFLVDAAPVLLEIAAAALEHERAVQTFRHSAEHDDRPVFEGHRHRMNLAHDVLLAALAKVSP